MLSKYFLLVSRQFLSALLYMNEYLVKCNGSMNKECFTVNYCSRLYFLVEWLLYAVEFRLYIGNVEVEKFVVAICSNIFLYNRLFNDIRLCLRLLFRESSPQVLPFDLTANQ